MGACGVGIRISSQGATGHTVQLKTVPPAFLISRPDQETGMDSFKFTLEVASKAAFRMERTPLYGGNGQTQVSSDLHTREAVHYTENKHHPQVVPEL
jgi:hypothetical protein